MQEIPTFNTIAKLMTSEVISVPPDMPLIQAVDTLIKKGFTGLPVVDHAGKLVGILTEYDLVIKGSSLHLPTFLKLLEEFEIYRKDQGAVKSDVSRILKMKVEEVMNREPLTLLYSDTIEKAVRTFGEHHKVNPILVTDEGGHLVGVLSRYDLIKLLGAPSVKLIPSSDERQVDRSVNVFLKDFEDRFVMVRKSRASSWLLWSIAFAVIGFVIAFALILRIR